MTDALIAEYRRQLENALLAEHTDYNRVNELFEKIDSLQAGTAEMMNAA